jgi:hypothetical protein
LFPKNVRDRLYNAQENEGAKDGKNGAFINRQLDLENGIAPDGGSKENSRPIADLFPEVTVLFADLVGEQLFAGSSGTLCFVWFDLDLSHMPFLPL